jgi:hypothetical protein
MERSFSSSGAIGKTASDPLFGQHQRFDPRASAGPGQMLVLESLKTFGVFLDLLFRESVPVWKNDRTDELA